MIKKLLVIIPDHLSALINKGEVVPRYYNPGNLFDEVHIVMTNNDQPDPALVRPMVGHAKLFIYNHPEPPHFFTKTLGWQPFLMQKWLKSAIALIWRINPLIIRCYGMHLNLLIASYYKKKFKVPLLVSLHTHPYFDSHKTKYTFKEKIVRWCELRLAKYLKYADMVIPVYIGITYFLNTININKYKILYNIVGIKKRHIKKDWSYLDVFKIVCIGQQIPNKNPENLIKAVAQLENVVLDIIGMGPLHENLKELVAELNIENKIKFIEAIPHIELCKKLKTYDCFAASIDCIGLSKIIIESFLVGLPVLLNINSKMQVPELNSSLCLSVPDSVEGFTQGIKYMMSNQKIRETYAKEAFKTSWKNWSPIMVEKKHIDTYKKLFY